MKFKTKEDALFVREKKAETEEDNKAKRPWKAGGIPERL